VADLKCFNCCRDEDDFVETIIKPMDIWTVTVYSILSIVFLVSGYAMIGNLQTYYPKFYEEYKKYLWGATLFLAIPLLIRVIFDLAAKNETWGDIITGSENSMAIYNLSFFTLTTYLPIVSQITSLVFGFVRNK